MRLGVLGTAADPIHNGHLRMARGVKNLLGLDRILLIVAADPPHKQGRLHSSDEHRYQMAMLSARQCAGMEVSHLELDHPTEPYTYQTVDRLYQRYGEQLELYWIVGSDWVASMHTVWKLYEYLLTRINVVVVTRCGYPAAFPHIPEGVRVNLLDRRERPLFDSVQPAKKDRTSIILCDGNGDDISSTQIRHRLAAGLPVTGLLPKSVEEYIRQHNLYGT